MSCIIEKRVYYCLEEKCNCKNFTATTNSILFSTKKATSLWITFMKAYLDKNILEVCANKAGISENTAFFWCQKVHYFLSKSLNQTVLKGDVELDETVYSDNQIGLKNTELQKKPKKRGMSNDKVNIATAIVAQGDCILKVSINGRITTNVY